jgi:hypothetical protein
MHDSKQKDVKKISTSTRPREILYTDSQDMLVLSYTVASCYYNCCTDGSTNPGRSGFPSCEERSNWKVLSPLQLLWACDYNSRWPAAVCIGVSHVPVHIMHSKIYFVSSQMAKYTNKWVFCKISQCSNFSSIFYFLILSRNMSTLDKNAILGKSRLKLEQD